MSQSQSSSPQRPTDNSSMPNTPYAVGASSQPIRCHFCHKIGHYKNNCRQYLALRNHPGYGDRLQQPQSMQLIYDHLEDSVFAPKSCRYTTCTNPQCDGSACYTSFAYSDFEQAETYFNNNILPLVENVKLHRPADSLPPLTRSSYVAQQADWGESEDAHDTSWDDEAKSNFGKKTRSTLEKRRSKVKNIMKMRKMTQKKPTQRIWKWRKRISPTPRRKTTIATNRSNPSSAPGSRTCTYLNRA
jgi:hypothetical protein